MFELTDCYKPEAPEAVAMEYSPFFLYGGIMRRAAANTAADDRELRIYGTFSSIHIMLHMLVAPTLAPLGHRRRSKRH